MLGTSRHRARTSTLPLGEMTLNKSESESVANEIFHRQRLSEDIRGVVDARDSNEFDEAGGEVFVNSMRMDACMLRAMLDVGLC